MTIWIKPLRLQVGCLASLLTVAGLRVAGITSTMWILPTTVFAITCATMVQNDWRDRFHDVEKGKDLAFRYAKGFLALTIFAWATAIALTAVMWLMDGRLAVLAVLVIIVGMTYSEARQIAGASTLLVAVTSASPALFPVFIEKGSLGTWLLFLSAALVILGREVTKDIDDMNIDAGYKKTIPLLVGESRARVSAATAGVLALIVAAGISPAILLGLPLVLGAGNELLRGGKPKTARLYLDAALVLVTLWLVLSN